MKENKTSVHVLTSLDDIVWLLNIRGNDIPCNPVVLSYLVLTETEGHLFIQEKALSEEVKSYLQSLGMEIHSYDSVYDFVSEIKGETILLEKGHVNYSIFQSLAGDNTIIDMVNPAALMKAIKIQQKWKISESPH